MDIGKSFYSHLFFKGKMYIPYTIFFAIGLWWP